MKFLHTSDWHLGRSLYGRKRYDEFTKFLDWLAGTIELEKIDVLLVAGDIFDTNTPGNRAQELYYRFLCRVSASCCRHIVIIAGNHDSPSFLNAPKEILKALDITVTGAKPEDPEDEVITIGGIKNLIPEKNRSAIICAVPYLRDKDIRLAVPGESLEDKNRKLVEGIKDHYKKTASIAEKRREELIRQNGNIKSDERVPIIAMGHLFTAGGKTNDGDGVRELYVGSLAHVSGEVFPSVADYIALGHLHSPQSVGGKDHVRYSGSPIPMGFGEAYQEKSVVIIEFEAENQGAADSSKPEIRFCPVPCFQPLERIVGSLENIHTRITQLKNKKSTAWLEIEYTGNYTAANLHETLNEYLDGSKMEILRIRNNRAIERIISRINDSESLDDLDPEEVFERCLEASQIPYDERKELKASYNQIVKDLHEDDINAD